MQLLMIVEIALMLLLAMKLSIGNIEQELRRKPIRYDDTD
jgi:hypothetical protein